MKKNNIDLRTRNVMVNTLASCVMKICAILCSLIIVPMTIGYLSPEIYGVWMAITSILYWIAFCDIGLGNGMRNYMSEAISKNDWKAARSYFSTAIILLSVIALVLCVVAIPLVYLSDLKFLFNTTTITNDVLTNAVMIAVSCSLLQFVVKSVGMVYVAMQKYAVNDFIIFMGHLCSVFTIYLLTLTTDGDLRFVIAAYTALPVLFYLFAMIPLLKQYPILSPSISCINIEAAKKIVFKGIGFFLIQITSCFVIFGSSNIILAHYCGPEQVTVYNVAYKVFFLLVTAYTIFISPLWNAYTDAATKGDIDWIRKTYKKSLFMWLFTVIGGLILLAICDWLYKLWIGESVSVPIEVSLCVMIYICLFNLNSCVTCLINGLNKIRVEIITSIIATVFYLIAVSVVKGSFGIAGILTCMIIAYIFMSVIHFYQCYLFINNKATGIWNK